MDMNRRIIATSPQHGPFAYPLATVREVITHNRGADSADIHCMLLDAGKPVTLTMRGLSVTFTPEVSA